MLIFILVYVIIGRTVVLLDEADIFLEQRSLEDLKRNALVSGKHNCYMTTKSELISVVFLRVLEYYDGGRLRTVFFPRRYDC